MKLEDNIRKIIMQIPSYEGVDPSLKLASESGIKPENIIKLNANENPFGDSLGLGKKSFRYKYTWVSWSQSKIIKRITSKLYW